MDTLQVFTLATGVLYIIFEIRQKNFMWVVGIATSLAAMWVFFREGLYASFGLNTYYFITSFVGLWHWRRDKKKLENSGVGEAGQDAVCGESDSSVSGDQVDGCSGVGAGVCSGVETVGLSDVGAGDCSGVGIGDCSGVETIGLSDVGTGDCSGVETVGLSGVGTGGQGDVIVLNRLSLKTIFVSLLVTVVGSVLLSRGMTYFHELGILAENPMSLLDSVTAVLSAVATWWLVKSYRAQWWLWVVADALSVALCVMQGMWPMALLYVVYVASAVYGLFYWKKHGVYV
jgi:nicotinamide riboside transporter PnuC